MDRRRLLMNALAFPDNYLFKEGLGIKEELGYLFSAYSGSSASLSKEEIYLCGGNETHGGIIFGENAKWVKGNYPDQTRYLFSDGLDLSEYKTLKVEMTCYSNTSRRHSIGILNESSLNTNSPNGMGEEKIATRRTGIFSKVADFYDTTETRQVYSLDISSFDKGTILIQSGDFGSTYARIHNIWLE